MSKRVQRTLSLLLVMLLSLGMLPVLSVPTRAATANQLNMVARADYMYDTTWICQQTVGGWSGTFYAGNTYHIPYGQPIYSGKYIGYSATVEEFLTAAATPGSIFYTGRSYYTGTTAPYYVSDCSAFVSWCWGIDRTTTYYIPGVSTKIGAVTTHNCTYSLQLGDALNHPEHVILVSGLSYDSSGAITQIEITEQTPPQLKRSYYTPAQLASKYSAYTIYRYYGNVPAAPNAKPLEGWQLQNNVWYYYVNGVKQTGWLKDGGTWYYLNPSDGAMHTGWLNEEGTWYYLKPSNGAMVLGWQNINGAWYFMNRSNGVMQTGWITVDGCKYYMNPANGIMQTGWVQTDDTWYYLNPSNGIMQTGWVTVNGSVYYLDSDGKMVTGKRTVGGIEYEFDDSGALINGTYEGGMAGDGKIWAKGVDISYRNGESCDLQAVKDAGYDYVILRAGSSNLGKDPYFETFYARARAVGLDVGAYFYSYATTPEGAVSDARKCLTYIQGKKFEYPIYFDYEDPGQANLTRQQTTDICLAFMDAVAAEGYVSGVYSYASRFDNMDMVTICAEHEAWIANYYDETYTSLHNTYSTGYGMYQYSDETRIGSALFNANVSYKDYPGIMKKHGLNGYTFTNDSGETTGVLPGRPGISPDKLYFPACAGDRTSLTEALNSVGMSYVSLKAQLSIAQVNGFTDYAYTEEQNSYLLGLLKDGELVMPNGISFEGTPVKYLPQCDSGCTTLIAALNSVGVNNVTPDYQMRLAIANGISGYGYSAEEQNRLLDMLKGGRMIAPDYVVLTGWQDLAGTWYYYEDGTAQTGWLSYGGKWYYLDDQGKMVTGWRNVNGTWYYMNEGGDMRKGWLCENGTWYYLDDSGAMVTGTRVIDGVSYTFNASGAWIPSDYAGGMAGDGKVWANGIDVSYWNGTNFDFQTVKNAGYDFVIIRCGSTNAGKDENFEMYYQKARAAGLDVGAYFYTYATTVEAAKSDAAKCLSYIAGKTFEYPIYFDFEDACQLDLPQSQQTQICLAFMDTLWSSGYVTGLCSYAAKIATMDMDTIGSKYECWIANYTYDDHGVLDPTYSTKYGMFQYKSTLYLGNMGPIDANVSYKDYPGIMRQYGLNGYEAEKVCTHTMHNTAGVCTDCGETVFHEFSAGSCVICGLGCYHQWQNGVCSVCSESCGHPNHDIDGVCTTCSVCVTHSYVNGVCSCGGKDPNSIPVISPKYPSLSFEDEVFINVYFAVENPGDLRPGDMGLLTWIEPPVNGTADNAQVRMTGAELNTANGLYSVRTRGIPAKSLADTVYFKVYLQLEDGSYIYSKLLSYSPRDYADTILAGSYGTEVKSLMVAMLNYGAAAQEYFQYHTDNLASQSLAAEHKAMVRSYGEDMVPSIAAVDSSKVGIFSANGGFSRKYPSVTFESAFCINYHFTASQTPDSVPRLYYWTQSAYENAAQLTPSNATGMLVMSGTGEYTATVSGIAAKDLAAPIYVAGGYNSDGSSFCTGVLAYSIGSYCADLAEADNPAKPLAEATAVYGYYAHSYFTNS